MHAILKMAFCIDDIKAPNEQIFFVEFESQRGFREEGNMVRVTTIMHDSKHAWLSVIEFLSH